MMYNKPHVFKLILTFCPLLLGAKEIDIAATLEHIRDQRINMAKTKVSYKYILSAEICYQST